MKAFKIRVYGRVQRVGFRSYVLEIARYLGLSGYIKNEKDDSVTIFVQGKENLVSKFMEAIKRPPPPIEVKEISINEVAPRKKLKYF